MASGVKVGQLVIDMAADVAHLKTDMAAASTAVGDAMQKVQASVELAKSAFIALTGVASVKVLEGIVLGAIDGAAKLHELSIQAGISVEALSGLAAVGKATGTGADTIAEASNKLSKALATSTEDSKGAAAALKALGLSFDDFQKMSPDERMKQVADAMDGFADGGQKSAAAMLLFGKTGAEMLPMLKDLADAGELHAKVTSEQAEQAHEFEVALAKLQLQGQAWKKSLAMELLPTLDDVVKTMLDMSASSKDLGSEAGKGLTVFLQTAAVLGVNTFYVLKQIAIEIGGMAAQMVAVAHLDFSGAAAIGVAMKEDAAAARVEVDKLSASLLAAHTAQTTQNGYNARQGFGEKSQITGLEGNAGGPSATAAIDAQANAYKSLIASMREKIAIDDLEAAGGQKLTQAQQLGLDIEKMATEGKITSAMAGSALVKTLLDEVDASEKKKTAALAINKVISDALKYQADQNKLDAQHILAMRDYVQAQQDSSDALTFEIGLMGQSADVRAAAIAQYQVALDLKKKIAAIDADPYYQNNQVARDAAVAQAQTVSAQKAADAVKRVTLDTWNSTYDQVSSDLADALLKAGQDGGASLRSYLETELLSKPFKLIVQALIQPVATSMTNLITGGSTGGGILNSISNASTLSNMGMGYGIGNAAGTMVANATGTGIDGLLATNGAYGTAGGAMGALGTAMPYIGAAVVAYSLLNGNNTKSTAGTGQASTIFDGSGNVIGTSNYAAWGGSNATTDKMIAQMEGSYLTAAKSLGIAAASTSFSYGGNTGKQGENPNFAIASSVGATTYASGETGLSDAAVQLAASRAVFSALQASNMPRYLSGVFDGITASTATQDQITASLTAAQALADFHTQLGLLPTQFQSLSSLSYAATQSLIGFSGGLDALKTNLSSYYTNFYTSEEQRAQTIANINAATAGSGLDAATATRDQFRAIVDAQDLTTASGQKMYAALMSVAGAFAGITPAAAAAADTSKTLLDTVTKAASAAMDGLKKSVDAQKATLTAAFDAQVTLFNDQINSVTTSIGKLQTLAGSLKSTLDGMRVAGSDAQYRQAAQAQISAALAIAKAGGGLPVDGQLTSALATVSKPSEALFSTFKAYATDFYKTANDISKLNDLTGTQLTADQTTQAILNAQLKALNTTHTEDLAKLDNIVTMAQSQLDAANGINTSVLSVADAVKALGSSIDALVGVRSGQGLPTNATTSGGGASTSFSSGGASGVASGTGTTDTSALLQSVAKYAAGMPAGSTGDAYYFINGVNDVSAKTASALLDANILGTSTDPAVAVQTYTGHSLAYWQDMQSQFDAGLKPTTTTLALNGAHANGGIASGWSLVGEHGAEVVNFSAPARVYTAQQSRDIMAGGSNEALVQALAEVKAELAALRASSQRIESHTDRTSKTLLRVTRDGESMVTST